MSRALTIKQPWADLILAGVKDVENRTWPVPSTLPQWWRCSRCDGRTYFPGALEGVHHVHNEGTEHETDEVCHEDGPFPFRLWIHAGKSIDHHTPNWAWAALPTDRHRRLSERYGVLLGSVLVTGCHHADECQVRHITLDPRSFSRPDQFPPGTLSPHAPVGYCSRWAEPDCWHWPLTDPQPLDEPIPMRGRQGLWTLEEVAA